MIDGQQRGEPGADDEVRRPREDEQEHTSTYEGMDDTRSGVYLFHVASAAREAS